MGVSKKTLLGMAFESPNGTAATVPAVWVPVNSSVLKGTIKKERPNEERGDIFEVHDSIPTNQEGACDPKGAYYNDVHPYFIKACGLGTVATSQPDATHAATVYDHAFSAGSPPSLTLFKSYDGFFRQSSYSVVEKLGFKWAAEAKLLECEPSLKSNFKVNYTGAWSPTLSTLKPFAGYAATLTLDGVASADISEMSLNLVQKCTYWYAINGNPDYITAYFDSLAADIDFTARLDSPTNVLAKHETKQKSSLAIVFTGPLIVNSGPSGTPPNTNYFQSLTINIGQFDYDSAEEDTSKGNVMVKVKGIVEAVSGNLVTFTVRNTIATY